MKILIDARLYGHENAGLGRYVVNLIEGLIKLDSKNNYVILLRKKYFDSLTLPPNWKKVEVDLHHYSFMEQIKLPRIIKRENPNIVHFPHFNVPIFFQGKFIVTIHDMLMHKSVGLSATTLPAPAYLVKRLGYRFVFDNAVRRSQKIIVPSNAVKEELNEVYSVDARKIKVTYEGFDKKISKGEGVGVPRPYFTYIGNAYPHKNLIKLIKAIKLLNTKSSQQVFLAISSARNIFTQRIINMARGVGAEKFVKFLGFVPDEDLGGLLSGSIGFVFPSFSEGFGLPGLEAMSSGTLLIASDIPVFREVYQKHAIYFDPKDVGSIEKALEESIKLSQSEREKIIQDAKEFVNIYSWDKMAQETLNIYAESGDSIRQSQ